MSSITVFPLPGTKPFLHLKEQYSASFKQDLYEVRVFMWLQEREGSSENKSILLNLDFRILPCIKGDNKRFWLLIFSVSSIHYGSPICKLYF